MAVSKAKGQVSCDSALCSGCRTCEVVCSLFHEGFVNLETARIQTVTEDWKGWQSEVYTCNQCENAACVAACPTNAIYMDVSTGAKLIDEERCNGCRLCIEACSYTPSRIRYDSGKNVCVKCDLCGGKPHCVDFCQEGALNFKEV